MRKWTAITLTLAATVGLAGCNQAAEPTQETSTELPDEGAAAPAAAPDAAAPEAGTAPDAAAAPAAAGDAATPAPEPTGAAPSSSGGRVTPPSQ